MTITVSVPDLGEVDFPDGTPRETMESAIKNALTAKTAQKTKREIVDDVIKNRGWGSGFAPFTYEAGGRVTDMTGSPALGGVTNFFLNALPAFLTSGRVADAPSASLLETPAKKLMQSAVKPSLADRASGAADRALDTMLKENIYPTPGGMDKAGRIIGKLNEGVESAIAASPANVNVPAVMGRLDPVKQKFGMQVNPQADVGAVENVGSQFIASPHIAGRTDIPVQLAHQLKKGTYAALGGKSYGEVGSASTEAQKALARGLREEVASAVPKIVEPLKREASLMNVRDVAMNRALQNANNNPLGLAALRLDHPLSATMTMADRIAALKALIAMQMYGLGKTGTLAPLGTTSGLLGLSQEKK